MLSKNNLKLISEEPVPYVDSIVFDGISYGRGAFNTDWVSLAIADPKVICDVGCYDCGDSIRFKTRFPTCEVYAFEASPSRHGGLRTTTSKYGIHLVENAVADVDGTMNFYDSLVDGTRVDAQGSFFVHSQDYKNKYPRIKQNRNPTQVQTITMDTFCKSKGITEIDLLYVDVEGAEMLVVKGMKDLRPKIIFIETAQMSDSSPMWVGDIRGSQELETYLLSIGYVLGKILSSDRLYYHESVLEK